MRVYFKGVGVGGWNKKNIINLSSAELAQSVVKVNVYYFLS